jgi:hypothetical protein
MLIPLHAAPVGRAQILEQWSSGARRREIGPVRREESGTIAEPENEPVQRPGSGRRPQERKK